MRPKEDLHTEHTEHTEMSERFFRSRNPLHSQMHALVRNLENLMVIPSTFSVFSVCSVGKSLDS